MPDETTSEQLAAKIAARLVKEGLLSVDAAAKLKPKLAQGTVTQDDWRLPVELGDKKKEAAK
ncbi:MAG: hypothetical protein ACOYOU_22255 [Kiritimatiellia bacterium]